MASLLLTAMRDHLAGLGLVRVPRLPGTQPPLWLDKIDGTPAPGEGDVPVEVGDDLVLNAMISDGIAPAPYESVWRNVIVDIQFRGRTPTVVELAEQDITAALIDRRDWDMGAVRVIESEQWNALARLGSDQQSYDFRVAYSFQLYRDIP